MGGGWRRAGRRGGAAIALGVLGTPGGQWLALESRRLPTAARGRAREEPLPVPSASDVWLARARRTTNGATCTRRSLAFDAIGPGDPLARRPTSSARRSRAAPRSRARRQSPRLRRVRRTRRAHEVSEVPVHQLRQQRVAAATAATNSRWRSMRLALDLPIQTGDEALGPFERFLARAASTAADRGVHQFPVQWRDRRISVATPPRPITSSFDLPLFKDRRRRRRRAARRGRLPRARRWRCGDRIRRPRAVTRSAAEEPELDLEIAGAPEPPAQQRRSAVRHSPLRQQKTTALTRVSRPWGRACSRRPSMRSSWARSALAVLYFTLKVCGLQFERAGGDSAGAVRRVPPSDRWRLPHAVHGRRRARPSARWRPASASCRWTSMGCAGATRPLGAPRRRLSRCPRCRRGWASCRRFFAATSARCTIGSPTRASSKRDSPRRLHRHGRLLRLFPDRAGHRRFRRGSRCSTCSCGGRSRRSSKSG